MRCLILILAVALVCGTTAALYACKSCVVDREPVQTYFGLNADPVGSVAYTDTRRFFNLFRETGAGSARIPLRWELVEPKRGEFIFARADAAFANFPADVEIVVTLTGTPDWAKVEDAAAADYPFKDLGDWTRFVEAVVGRYKNRVRHWEIWDGPDSEHWAARVSARGYLDVLRTSHGAIKRIDPKCLVILGGVDATALMAGEEPARAKVASFWADLYEAGGAAYFDAANVQARVQPLSGAARVAELAREAAKLMAKYGDAEKPLYVSRVDLAAGGGDDEAGRAAQAQLLAETYQLLKKEKQVCHVFWYSLRDARPVEVAGGLLDARWGKRPAFEAFRRAASEKVIK